MAKNRQRTMKFYAALGLGTAIFMSAAQAQALDDATFQRIAQSAFAPVIEKYQIPGLAIGVTLNGEQHFFTYGVASRDPSSSVDTETLFELGSVSKLFNVALAALAEQKDILSLNDLVSDTLPALKGSAFDQITLYDLAAHANGGLPLQVPDEITTNAQLTEWLTDWKPAEDPQTVRAYSNLSIGLLGQIVGDRLSGSYERALNEHILPQLGLGNTFINVPDEAMSRYAFGYSKIDDSPIRVTPGMLDSEAYGIKSSVADVTRFLDAHLGNVDLTPDMAAALARTREAHYDTAHFAQAMVWEEYTWPVDTQHLQAGNGGDMVMKPQPIRKRDAPLDGPVFLNKTGATNGFGAYVAMVPEQRIGVVVLANRNYPNIARADATVSLINDLLAESVD